MPSHRKASDAKSSFDPSCISEANFDRKLSPSTQSAQLKMEPIMLDTKLFVRSRRGRTAKISGVDGGRLDMNCGMGEEAFVTWSRPGRSDRWVRCG